MEDDDKEKPEGLALSYLGAVGWTFGLSVLVALIAGPISSLGPRGGLDLVTLVGAQGIATLLVLMGMARLHAPEDRMGDILGARPSPWALVVLAMVVGAAAALPLATLDDLMATRFQLGEDARAALADIYSTDTPRKRVALAVTLLASAAFDELFYRGAVFGLLERDKPREMAVFATTAIGLFLQFDPLHLATALILGALAAHARALSQSLFPALALRVAFYAVPAATILSGHEKDSIGAGALATTAVAAVLGAAFFVFLARRLVGPGKIAPR